MGATGVRRGTPNFLPITGKIGDMENAIRRGDDSSFGNGNVEVGAVYNEDGSPIIGYLGERHFVNVDDRVFDNPNAIFTHFHPNKNFGGTLSMADLSVFADSQLKELRAYTRQGNLYSIKADANVDRAGLAKWVQKNQKLAQSNFEKSYKGALKAATTPLKSGPHKGQIKLVNRRTGKAVYRAPMTKEQAVRYARQYSVGMFERMYKKALKNYGVTYTSTKGQYAPTAR